MNKFVQECKITEAKARINKIAKNSTNFADFEYEVMHDKAITNLVPKRIIKMFIQTHAAELD